MSHEQAADTPYDQCPWTLVVRTADNTVLAVMPDAVTAARLVGYLCRESDSPRSALRTEPATHMTMPKKNSLGQIAVERSWWRIVQDGDVLLAAFLLEPHARGWHETETVGIGCLLGPGTLPGRPDDAQT